jgi:hypothetical protein
MRNPHTCLRKDKRAVSPAISTVILTASVIVMIMVAMSYANNILGLKVAENEFSSNQQFMRTTGQQIDDIAWTIGRTQTVSYSGKYGQVSFQPHVLTYTIEVHHPTTGWTTLPKTYTTGMILYNMPVRSYSMGNDFFVRVPNYASGSFVQSGSTAPIAQVFSIEKMPMNDGSYIRTVVVPTARMIGSNGFYKFYLPTLENGTHLFRSQSITMCGNDVSKVPENHVDQVRITVSFPKATEYLDNSFFNFKETIETISLPSDSHVEFYVGNVVVTLGQV